MTGKNVSALCRSINTISILGPDNRVTGISYDSRKTKPGDLYCAMGGVHTDGHAYIPEAIGKGAVGVLCSQLPEPIAEDVSYILVENSRAALSPVSAALYDNPSEHLDVIGVTGTDGKSTTVYFIHQLFEGLGVPSGFLSTVHFRDDASIQPNPYRQSTPEAPEIHSMLKSMLDHGKKAAVLEATSHGLSPQNNRLGDVHFDAAVFTNLSHEHLEFHRTFEQYRDDKANLFRSAASFGVVNLDDDQASYFSAATDKPVYSYSMDSPRADLYVKKLYFDKGWSTLILRHGNASLETRFNLPGRFHVEDLLAALLTLLVFTGKALGDFDSLIPLLKAVPGRMEEIHSGQPFSVVVDYAHTPGSFSALLPQVREQTAGKLIVLFGSAGERDFEKRELQGRLACRYADMVFLADEDPRGEEGLQILKDIAKGCGEKAEGQTLFLIPDRKQAIRTAFSAASPGDRVLLLGKGHESSIIYREGPIPWNEAEVARALLHEMGYNKTYGSKAL